MFNPFNHEDSALDDAIHSAFIDLARFDAEHDEYHKILKQISELYKLQDTIAQLNLQAQQASAAHQLAETIQAHEVEQDERPFWQRVNPDTLLTVAGNLVIGFAVIKYEKTGVISSKVMSFMKKI